jgi:hypothetical protein
MASLREAVFVPSVSLRAGRVEAVLMNDWVGPDASERIGLIRETSMSHINRDPVTAETGKQVPARPHDSGSAANETTDGLDATTEALRRAAEDTPSGDGQGKIDKIPVFDRADLAPKV